MVPIAWRKQPVKRDSLLSGHSENVTGNIPSGLIAILRIKRSLIAKWCSGRVQRGRVADKRVL